MADLRLGFRILGPLEVVWNERRVDVGGTRQRAVLAALLVDAGRTVTRDRLIEFVWGDQPPPSALGTLQTYLSHLRKALEPARFPRAPAAVLVTHARGYALEVPQDLIDANRFESLTDKARSLLAQSHPGQGLRAVDEALSLWRGEALADFDEPSARIEAARLDELRALALETRLDARLALGDHAAVAVEAEALVAAEPLRERLWEILVLSLYRSGRRGDALGAYRRAQQVLADELGLDPRAALQHLEVDVLAESPRLDWHPATEVRDRVTGAAPAGADTVRATERPLAGRTREVEALRRSIENAAAGRGRVVLISGEPGIGKTRLAQELRATATAGGMKAAWGTCLEGGVTSPFRPWIEVFRELHRGGEDRPFASLLAGHASKERTPASRIEVLDATAQEVAEHATAHPLLVVLDDAQWADPASLQLLGFVASRARTAPLLVAIAYRNTDLEPGHPLLEVLGALARDVDVERISLQGLDRDAVEQFVRTVSDGAADADVAATVMTRTEGNPFFVSELVRLLQTERVLESLRIEDVVAAGVPANVRDVIGRRLTKLPTHSLDALSTAATVGRMFDVAVVAAVEKEPVGRILDRMESAVLAGIVAPPQAPVGRWSFVHDLVRDVVYGRLTAVRRARLHAAIAEALLGFGGSDLERAYAIAHHCWAGAMVTGPERALPHILGAANRALAEHAYERCTEQLERALSLLETMPDSHELARQRRDTATRLSAMRAMVQGYAAPETGEALRKARRLTSAAGGGRGSIAALWGLAAYHNVRAEFGAAQSAGSELLSLGSHDPASRATGYQILGVTHVHGGQFDRARDDLHRALESVDEPSDQWPDESFRHHLALSTLCFLAVVCAHQGDRQGAETFIQRALARATAADEPYGLALVQFFSAWVATVVDDPQRALEAAKAVQTTSQDHSFRFWTAAAAIHAGWARSKLGEADGGEDQLQEGLREVRSTGSRMLEPYFLGLLAEVQRDRGRLAQAAATVREAQQRADEVHEHLWDERLHLLSTSIARQLR